MRRLLTLAAATLLLVGCEAPPVYGPSPTPSVEPFFANEQEALDAVNAFMEKYVAASDAVYRSGGSDRAALAALTSGSQLQDELDAAEELANKGQTLVGSLGFFGIEIQQVQQDSATEAYVQAYVCLDYRQSQYVAADGVTFEGVRDWAPFEAILTAHGDSRLIMEELRYWTGRDFCAQRA